MSPATTHAHVRQAIVDALHVVPQRRSSVTRPVTSNIATGQGAGFFFPSIGTRGGRDMTSILFLRLRCALGTVLMGLVISAKLIKPQSLFPLGPKNLLSPLSFLSAAGV
jgi:hypothetical protein